MPWLATSLDKVIKELGIRRYVQADMALQVWNEAVGEMIAKNTEPINIENGKMIVKVKSDTWRNELTFKSQEIIEKINKLVGEKTVREIVFK